MPGSGRARRAAVLLVACACAVAFVAAVRALHLIVNVTPSMPLGLYRTFPPDRAPARGDVVVICAPPELARFAASRSYLPHGPCPSHTAPFIKHVAAAAGDSVDVSATDVRVDGTALPGSARLARDDAGRPIPAVAPGRYRLHLGDVWLWTPSPKSWDSRYYGPVPARGIRAFAHAFLVLP